MGIKLSKHFVERWKERVGTRVPSDQEFDVLLRNSTRLQKPAKAYSPRGYPRHKLGIYLLPEPTEPTVVVKTDPWKGRAVTLITRGTVDEGEE